MGKADGYGAEELERDVRTFAEDAMGFCWRQREGRIPKTICLGHRFTGARYRLGDADVRLETKGYVDRETGYWEPYITVEQEGRAKWRAWLVNGKWIARDYSGTRELCPKAHAIIKGIFDGINADMEE